jgi:DNA-directed RNA polymerase specialized sigma24 family protein
VAPPRVGHRAAPGAFTHLDAYDDGLGAEVWALVESLPRKARAAVVLRYHEQLTEAEVAEILGISVGTVKSQAGRASPPCSSGPRAA